MAFARNPMLLANIGYDLQAYSKGRFMLGLGSQIKPHITKRFSMPWSHPAPRMREMILAIRAIWDCWNNGTKLDFRGDFYTHTLMTPFFNPGPEPATATPKVFLAGVGELMTEVAGEVCDGFLCHGFTTEKYLREVTLPGARARAGPRPARRWRASRSSGPSFVVTGTNEEEMEAAADGTRQQIAFYGSTPAYRTVLETARLGRACRTSSTRCRSRASGWRWARSSTTRSSTRSPSSASPSRSPPSCTSATATCIQRISFYAPYKSDPERWRGVMEALKAA